MIKERLDLGADSLVVEFASNDGYLLQHFLPLGVPVLGIEPAENVARVAVEKGVPTRAEFFGVKLADQLAAEGPKADLIAGNNVLAQVPDLNDFVAGIARLLKPEGVVTLEFPHIGKLIAENQFDTIYHEHFSYFSLTTIEHLAARHGLKVIDVEELPTHGGSLRVYLAHWHRAARSRPRVDALIARGGEHRAARHPDLSGLRRAGEAHQARAAVVPHRRPRTPASASAATARRARATRCSTTAASAPTSSTSPSTATPTSTAAITPGMHIPIYPVEAIAEAKPDYILILPWNLKNEIVEQMRFVEDWGGKFVVPIPEVTIIDPKELQP